MTKNKISKTWDGRIVDTHNNLSVSGAYVYERHNRIKPVLVTSTNFNAMQRACAVYNRALV